jgi:hypothetical protein
VPPELLGLLNTALPAITALAGVAVGGWLQSRRDTATHRRAAAAARTARLRKAFEPVIIAAMGVKSAAGEYFMSSGDPRVNSKAILDRALTTVNEARAQLMIEADVEDVFQELDRIWKAYTEIAYEVGGRMTARERGGPGLGAGMTAEDMKGAFDVVNGGPVQLVRLMSAHLRRIEDA